MQEILVEIYGINENYHNNKEQMVWLATTIYLGFSITILGWLSSNKSLWINNRWFFITFIFLVFIISAAFVSIQNWYKCRSVLVTLKLNKLIAQMDESNKPNYKQIKEAIEFPVRMNLSHKSKIFFTIGFSGVIILFAMLLFCISQILFVSII